MEQIVNDFNDIAINMLSELRKIIPHSIILNNIDLIEGITKNNKSKHVLIDNFVLHVLKYKKEIDSENEDFFLKNNFDDLKNKQNNNILKIIKEIKDMWKSLGNDKENKKNIFGYFKVLCFYAEKYFLEIDVNN